MSVLATLDSDLSAFLDDMTRSHPDTAIVLHSDHGSHGGLYWSFFMV